VLLVLQAKKILTVIHKNMRKVIFLCLVLIIFSVNIYAIHKAKVQGKVKESSHHKISKAKTSVSLTAQMLTKYLAFHLMCEAK
jgi:hypothetical protein